MPMYLLGSILAIIIGVYAVVLSKILPQSAYLSDMFDELDYRTEWMGIARKPLFYCPVCVAGAQSLILLPFLLEITSCTILTILPLYIIMLLIFKTEWISLFLPITLFTFLFLQTGCLGNTLYNSFQIGLLSFVSMWVAHFLASYE